ncbi:helix-turn-helix transcriptional regulator (plasmid) [Rhizobium sp. CB3171]|uniref:helix-turn-helix domain-containing protein n=1 Tax=Rhizobium sp. CB3171 TaxID=3039157 RepID=UPI0024B1C32D|nr:helix-turn-helix transcriptional regulator [Rhizobium sp. CB3171]WFU07199.1 helix-turn-helix transcriptional regulator [Rhizobium sp. CB3171]
MTNLLPIGTIKRRPSANRMGFQEDWAHEAPSLLGRIRAVLLEHERRSGLTRTDFVKTSGFPRQTFYEILEGSANLRLSSVDAIAKALDINIYELLGVPAEMVKASPEMSAVRQALPPKD